MMPGAQPTWEDTRDAYKRGFSAGHEQGKAARQEEIDWLREICEGIHKLVETFGSFHLKTAVNHFLITRHRRDELWKKGGAG
jgi:hypothetical protein